MAAESFTCPRCGAESWNPNDVEHGYCGRCHDFTGRCPHGTVETATLRCRDCNRERASQ